MTRLFGRTRRNVKKRRSWFSSILPAPPTPSPTDPITTDHAVLIPQAELVHHNRHAYVAQLSVLSVHIVHSGVSVGQ